MSNFQTLTTERLQLLIRETEETLSELKAELGRRDEQQQEHEIANLEHHMQSAELSLRSIRDFLAFLYKDMDQKKDG